jgi:hypothetical protein
MESIFNLDFREFIDTLNKTNVNYVFIGGNSVIIHGYNRTTGDLDLWIEPTSENFLKLQSAFQLFGLPVNAIKQEHFLDTDKYDVYTFGRPPVSIEILTQVKSLSFEETHNSAFDYSDDELIVKVIHINHLIEAKKASGRPQDLNDIQKLTNK